VGLEIEAASAEIEEAGVASEIEAAGAETEVETEAAGVETEAETEVAAPGLLTEDVAWVVVTS